jgi:hypothetical protein
MSRRLSKPILLVTVTAVTCFSIAATTGIAGRQDRTIILSSQTRTAISMPEMDWRCEFSQNYARRDTSPYLFCGQFVTSTHKGTRLLEPLGVALWMDSDRVIVRRYTDRDIRELFRVSRH